MKLDLKHVFNQGKSAAENGYPCVTCPWIESKDPTAYEQWLRGWESVKASE